MSLARLVSIDQRPGIATNGPQRPGSAAILEKRALRHAFEKGLSLQAHMDQPDAAERARCQPKDEREAERYTRIERAYRAVVAGRNPAELVRDLDFRRAVQEAVQAATLDELEAALKWSASKGEPP